MTDISPKSSRDAASRAARHSVAVLLLTSVHHAYGAYVYSTPWRYHAVLVAVPAALVIVGALAALRARPAGLAGALVRWLFAATVLVIPVLLFGVFEGFYNHLLKNVLYFGGLPGEQMARLFPPPQYEMPNDAVFEVTGILQVAPAALAARHLYRMIRSRPLASSPPYAAGEDAGAPLGGHA